MDNQATSSHDGTLIRQRRKEAGKPSCQFGKALAAASALGITLSADAAPDAAPAMPDFP